MNNIELCHLFILGCGIRNYLLMLVCVYMCEPHMHYQPGGGSHYTKHLDAHPPQKRTASSSDYQALSSDKPKAEKSIPEPKDHKRRHLTMIYYLNESFDGGKLRIYDPKVVVLC